MTHIKLTKGDGMDTVEQRLAGLFYTLDDYDRRIAGHVQASRKPWPVHALVRWRVECHKPDACVALFATAYVAGVLVVLDRGTGAADCYGTTLARKLWRWPYRPAARATAEARALLHTQTSHGWQVQARQRRVRLCELLHNACADRPAMRRWHAQPPTGSELDLVVHERSGLVYMGGVGLPKEKYVSGDVFDVFGLVAPKLMF